MLGFWCKNSRANTTTNLPQQFLQVCVFTILSIQINWVTLESIMKLGEQNILVDGS